MKPTDLIQGRTYYRLTFADRDLTMPAVEPQVYLGEVTDDDGTHGFVFQDTLSFVQHGNGLEGEEQNEEVVLYFVPDSEVGALYDIGEVAAEITEAARRAAESNHPTLKPLKAAPK